ncbi:hypothetical protein G9A89_017755 [Geosiphon pyriformis]|nr:hypothetical protein G9A89_017755 [Geosiphon pyriformis]
MFGGCIGGVSDHFNTDYLAVSISVRLDGLLDKQLNTLCKLANTDHWKLELLIAKIVKALSVGDSLKFVCLVKIWSVLNDMESSKISGLLKGCSNSVEVFKQLSVAKKHYCKANYVESELTKSASINRTIGKCIDDFVLGKDNMISSILEHFFCKVVLDHLVLNRDLILELAEVKTKVNNIMVNWIKKCKVPELVPNLWLGELYAVVKNLPDGKAAGLLGVSNKLWKHSDNLVLGCFLDLLNSCFMHEDIPALGNNFAVLKGTSTQLPVFVIGSIIEDTLEKGRELWLVLQDMWKAYDSVGWFHLRSSLRHIKMCNRFIKFFENIHLNRTNRVMTDFGLSDSYKMLDGLDQGKVFFPFLWKIFYDPLLCEIKKQKHLCEYRIDSRFIAKSDKVKSQTEMISFFAAGVFVNDTIWFFALNDISINTEKTVAISLNQRVKNVSLTISGIPIAMARRVLCKAISDKQFCYLVLSVLQPIISYRTQFSFILNAIIRRGLKIKTRLPHDFFTITLSHLSFYGIKTFTQSLDLQVASWLSVHLLCCSIRLQVNPRDNFLTEIVRIFSFCGLSFSILLTAFCHSIEMLISEVFSNSVFFGVACLLMHYEVTFADQLINKKNECFNWKCFKCWKQLDLYGPVPAWFDSAICFLGACLLAANIKPYISVNCLVNPVVTNTISKTKTIFLNSGLVLFDVFINSSVKHFGSCFVVAKTTTFFPKFGLGVGARVQGIMSSILIELKTIALVFVCIPSGNNVFIYSDSHAALSACEDELLLDLSFCVNNIGFYSMLAKGFMLNGWYYEALDALKDLTTDCL